MVVPEKNRYYYYIADSLPPASWSIVSDKTGRIWMETLSGLYFLDPDTGLYQKLDQYNTFSLLEESGIYHLSEDEKGIWIASSSGMYLLEPGKGITARYATDEKMPCRIPYDHLLHFYRDKAGIFWLASQGGGLIRFDPENGISRQFTTIESLSSNYGLMQFDKKSYRINTYLTGHGTGSGTSTATPPLPKGFVLEQNIPNPFDDTTTIIAALPITVNQAKIVIYNLQGIELQSYSLDKRGRTSIEIKSGLLQSGMYLYALLADG